MRKAVWASVGLAVAVAATASAWVSSTELGSRTRAPATPAEPTPPAPPTGGAPQIDRSKLAAARWFAAASGGVPEANQVQIEQDLALAQEVLGDGGYLLFGAGAGTPTVMVESPDVEQDELVAALADLFNPRPGRAARYRATTLQPEGPATAASVLAALEAAVAARGDPLLVYLAGHGHQGENARDAAIEFWGSERLVVADLAAAFEAAKRPVRLVMTTCYGGGFAELAFRGADDTNGAAGSDTCGLFATPWDLEASGCDPNPDRATQEGYGLHFLNALRARDREGNPLPTGEVDIDGDGKISLLEAHTRVRLASAGIDVPTTTSERWLRRVADDVGTATRRFPLLEEETVIVALSETLGFVGRETQAFVEHQRVEDQLEAKQRRLTEAQNDEDAAFRGAAADLLARWPVLDDPWHPRFAATIEDHRTAIKGHLEASQTYADYRRWRSFVDTLAATVAAERVKAAPLERLVRALDTRQLATRLHAKGGPDWRSYERLLACERWVP